jgi:hypothetical protein
MWTRSRLALIRPPHLYALDDEHNLVSPLSHSYRILPMIVDLYSFTCPQCGAELTIPVWELPKARKDGSS